MDASPGLHESKTITAAVAWSIAKVPLWSFQRGRNRFVSDFAKIWGEHAYRINSAIEF
ncbi:hypothetical protein [Mesorhizobium sp. CA4]|uniref:hypothetical protein n=1 Tax=Mesorhizobium sp. CA4 TaxID=588499 RepID=UPI001CD119BF|nr:hypothetical protein [Mesorhizobium sp. CA4]MBZ9817938.1 hypothetical protein [Mesorhizobium sp. CA4]